MTLKNTFDEDEALSLAERTFSTEINEQLASDIIQYTSRLHSRYLVNQQSTTDVVELLAEARDHVVNSTEPVRGRFIDEIDTVIEAYRKGT